MSNNILVVLEQRDGKYRKSAYEVATAAAELGDKSGRDSLGLVIGSDCPEDASSVGEYGLKKVFAAENDVCSHYIPEA